MRSFRSLGAKGLLFGTDYPYCDAEQFARHLGYLDEAGLEPVELEGIRGATASSLLDLGTRLAGAG